MISKSRLQRTTKERPHSSMNLLHGRRFSHITSRRRRSTAAQQRGARGTLRPSSPCCAHTYFSDATHEIERLRPTERQTVQICGKHGGIECTMRALRQIIDRSTPAELCSCDCTVLISTKTCRGKQMCTRAAREAISDNHTVCWSAHSADCRALPSRSISSDACTTRPSPGACGPP